MPTSFEEEITQKFVVFFLDDIILNNGVMSLLEEDTFLCDDAVSRSRNINC